MNVLKCILVQKVGFLKYKSGILHGYKMNSMLDLNSTSQATGQQLAYQFQCNCTVTCTCLNLLVPDDCFKYLSLYETYRVLTSECQNYSSVFSFLLKLCVFQLNNESDIYLRCCYINCTRQEQALFMG